MHTLTRLTWSHFFLLPLICKINHEEEDKIRKQRTIFTPSHDTKLFIREAIGGDGPETLRKTSSVGTFFKPQPSKLIGILKRTIQVDPQSCFTRKQVADFKFELGGAKVFLKIIFQRSKT